MAINKQVGMRNELLREMPLGGTGELTWRGPVRKGTKHLNIARNQKNDEFYTIFSDIEKEIRHYVNHFRNKTVLCNCDDPNMSNFSKYFLDNFEKLGLKELIISQHRPGNGICLRYHRDGQPVEAPLEGNGDFRSEECINLLRGADIIVTNPPFSLFREYIAQLIEYGKQFLIIGNWNAITYRDVFRLIKDDKMWIGVNSNRNFSGFILPKYYPLHGTEERVDEDSNRIISTNITCWYTNLDLKKRHEGLTLYKTYNSLKFPDYDNYDAIEVSKTADIPMDYGSLMGVPITFFKYYNPEQFEIIGSDYEVKQGLLPWLIRPGWKGKIDRGYIRGRRLYARIFIRNRRIISHQV